MKNTHDIFISYSTKDQKVVEGLSAYLEQNGIRCFVAYRDIPKGIVWAQAITEAIENCKLMVVVFSENFNCSKHVDREIEMCIEEGKTILTFKIENTEFRGVKKYFLKNLNWIDAFPNPEENFGKLRDNIIKLVPDIKEKKEENTEMKKTEGRNDEREKEKGEEKKKEKKQKNVKPKKIYLVLFFLLVCSAFWFIFFMKNRTQKIEENNANFVNGVTDMECVQDEVEGNIQSVKPVICPNNEKKKEQAATDDKIEFIKITYSAPSILVSTLGEQFETTEGDTFEGEIEKESGKIIQGKVKDKDNHVKHLFILKRHH